MENPTCPSWWADIKHFKPEEFDSPDAPGTGLLMAECTVKRLDAIRQAFGKPLKINSGYRTEHHNRIVGGGEHSAHMLGRAADVYTWTWTLQEKAEFVRLARLNGFTGVGRGSTFIHLDDMRPDEGYKRPLEWRYVNGRPFYA